jgi:hypothetical protein
MAVGEGEKKGEACADQNNWREAEKRSGHSSFARNFGLPSVPECPLKLGQNFELKRSIMSRWSGEIILVRLF